MWRKHRSVYQDHLIYICNNILKPFRVEILRYAEQVQEMHDLAKHLHTLSLKGESYEADNWKVHDKTLYVDGIWVAIKYRLPSSIQDELEDKQ